MSSTHIHLVRHGEVYNPQKILYGRLPGFRLSDNGVRQAKAAGRFLSDKPIRSIHTSPMLRARQTAREILAFHPHRKLHVSRLLNEVCTAFEGVPGDQVDRKNGDIYTGADACFEQPRDIFKRVEKFLKRSLRQFAGKHVVAVTHGDVVTFTVLWAFGWELNPKNKTRLRKAGFPTGYPAHASVTTLTFSRATTDERPQVKYTQPWSEKRNGRGAMPSMETTER